MVMPGVDSRYTEKLQDMCVLFSLAVKLHGRINNITTFIYKLGVVMNIQRW